MFAVSLVTSIPSSQVVPVTFTVTEVGVIEAIVCGGAGPIVTVKFALAVAAWMTPGASRAEHIKAAITYNNSFTSRRPIRHILEVGRQSMAIAHVRAVTRQPLPARTGED